MIGKSINWYRSNIISYDDFIKGIIVIKYVIPIMLIFMTDFEDEDPADSATLPEDILLSNEFSDAFAEVFDSLPEEDRLLLRGKYELDLDDAELAALLGCAPNSIRMKLTRARRRAVAHLLEGDYFSEQT